jgi:outer membrane protein
MKVWNTIGIAAMTVMALAGASFADIKIAHVDSKMIFEKYAETTKAQRDYDRQVQKWESEAQAKQKELLEMKERLEKQSLMLSEEKKRELETQFMKKKADYEQFVQQIYGKEGALYQKNQEISDPIIQKIKKTIQDVANQEGYDMVLDRSAGAVVFWKKDNDLTQRVLEILNKENPAVAPKR